MNSSIKHFLHNIRRFKLATGLNVAGLSVAFAAFLIIMMQVAYEKSFDRCHPNADCIYRVDRMQGEVDPFGSVTPRAFADAVFASSPHIKDATFVSLVWGNDTYMTVGEGASRRGFAEKVTTCYPTFAKLFGLTILAGDPNCLNDPEKLLIPQSLARRMFGKEDAVGQPVQFQDKLSKKEDLTSYTVGAVYKDLPENTQINNYVYTSIGEAGVGDWGTQNSMAYVYIDTPEAKQQVEDQFNSTFPFEQKGSPKGTKLVLTPLTDIYYLPNQAAAFTKTASPDTVKILLLIALLVIVVAGINFTNFSTALAPMRIKNINTRKVFGGSVDGLRTALVVEAMGICLLACLLSFGIVWGLNATNALSFVAADTTLTNHPALLGTILAVALAVGAVSGLYPAWYMTSYPPALVLKGSFGLSPAGRKLRTGLVGFQYIVSIILIVGALFIQLQNSYMRSYNLGFDKEQVAIVNLSSDLSSKHKESYVNRLKAHAGIQDVAFASDKLGGSDTYGMMGRTHKQQEIYTYIVVVSWNILDVLGIPVAEGRNFTPADAKSSDKQCYIYTPSVKEKYKMEVGDRLTSWDNVEREVIGFIGDVKFMSLRQDYFDMALALNDRPLPVSYIRLNAGADTEAVVNHIHKVVAELDPSFPLDVTFYDTMYNNLYQKEQYLKKMIGLFSILAIVISIIGVFGMVIFETQYRRKEIGIRRIHGATVRQILVMFNLQYMRIVLTCFALATPLALYGVRKWLEGFVYRTPIHWWVFAVALAIVALITILTVTFQNRKAANENPVDSVKGV